MWSLSATCSAFVQIPFHAELFVSAKQANTKTEWPDPFAWASQFNSFSNSRQPMPAPILSTARPLMRLETWNIMEHSSAQKSPWRGQQSPSFKGHIIRYNNCDHCITHIYAILKIFASPWKCGSSFTFYWITPISPTSQTRNWQNRLGSQPGSQVAFAFALRPSKVKGNQPQSLDDFHCFFRLIWSLPKKTHPWKRRLVRSSNGFFFFKWALPMFRFRIVGDSYHW